MIKDIRYSGFTTTPSDYENPDGELSAALNLIPEGTAVSPIMPPQTVFTLPEGYRCWFLHKVEPQDNYIISSGNNLYWLPYGTTGTVTTGLLRPIASGGSAVDFGTLTDIKAVGNTLIVLADGGIHYVLWKAEGESADYKYLGTHIPELPISFGLQGEVVRSDKFRVTLKHDSDIFAVGAAEITDEGHIQELTTQILGAVNKFVADNGTNAGRFIMPFLARYAFRLYDGSLTMHSAPVLMVTNTHTPACFIPGTNGGSLLGFSDGKDFRVASYCCKLDYKVMSESMLTSLREWKDIVTGVDIFVSAPFYTYDQAGQCKRIAPGGTWVASKGVSKLGNGYYELRQLKTDYNSTFQDEQIADAVWCADVPTKRIGDVGESIMSCSSLYLLKHLNLEDMNTNRTIVDVGDDYLQSLLTREVMSDDYDSHDTLKAGFASPYNSRLNLADMSKVLYSGAPAAATFQYTDLPSSVNTQCRVGIKQGGKTIIVEGDASMLNAAVPLTTPYFFFPNANAYCLWLKSGNNTYRFDLKKHPTLNGAYANLGWFESGRSATSARVQYFGSNFIPFLGTPPAVSTDRTVEISSKIYTSEINNPFVFPVTNINTIGTGDIIGLATAAKALSQGQFGQFPLYAFTTEGVWALEVSATGAFSARQPITRDVCINAASITQIDQAVLFATDRGIMMLSGSNSICISDDINAPSEFDVSTIAVADVLPNVVGEQATEMLDAISYIPFLEFIQECKMVYDYVHQRIFVYHPQERYAYVYSLKTKKWGMAVVHLSDTIESYPNALAMSGQDVVDFASREANGSVTGILITRPIHLEPGDALKTIDTVIQRGYFRPYKRANVSGQIQYNYTVKQVLFGTRDLFNYFVISSSSDHYLRGFSGTPYKAFRIALFMSLRKDESVAGCTIQYQPRFTNRPR